MCLTIIKPLTYKSRIQQIGDTNKFCLIDNEVFATASGCVFAPRYLFTDNITFINNTFVDIRASHIHDIGCAYRKLFISNLTEDDLISKGLLHLNEKATERERKFLSKLKECNKYDGDTNVTVMVCEDIPLEYIETIDVSFSENNKLFKDMLVKTGVPQVKANVMGSAVYLNAGWFLRKPKEMLPLNDVFSEIVIT